MPHKKKTRISAAQLHVIKTILPLTVVAVLLGATYYSQHIVPAAQPSSKHVKVVQLHSQPSTIKPSSSATPSPTPSPVPSPTPAVSTPVAQAAKPQPIVVPAPTSNVSGLTPAATPAPVPGNPTPTPTPSGSSTTTGYTSTNWSGYLATNAHFTSVSGAWRAPSPTGNGSSTTADSSWIGIGGVTSGDLIQVGTDNIVTSSGVVHTEAFYEMLPDVSQTVPGLTVGAGDSITASITETSPGQWNIIISDLTSGQTYNSTVTYTSSYSSAEWIEEDPSFSNGHLVPFDNFGSVVFNSGSTVAGSSLTIAGAGGLPITLVNNSHQAIATPSALTADGGGFTVTHN